MNVSKWLIYADIKPYLKDILKINYIKFALYMMCYVHYICSFKQCCCNFDDEFIFSLITPFVLE